MKHLSLIIIFVAFLMGTSPLLADDPTHLKPYGWWAPATAARTGSHGMAAESAFPKPSEEAASANGRPGHQGSAAAGHSVSDGRLSEGAQAGMTRPVSAPHGSAESAAASESKKDDKNPASAAVTVSHSRAMNRSPVHKIYLHVQGAAQPTEAPEVYYVVTARTLARHGGVPLGKTTHKAEVTMDKGVWRADIKATTFSTTEVFSRYSLDGTTVFSQYNFLHFLTDNDTKGLAPVPESPMPTDWPKLVFPEGSYNGMPFRGLQTGQTVDFSVANLGQQAAPAGGYLVDSKPGGIEPAPITFNPNNKKYTLSPVDDPSLVVVSGPMGGSSAAKLSVAVLPVNGSNEVMTFSLNVSLSRWSYRKLPWGLGLVAVSGMTATVAVSKRRKKFKFNKFNQQEEAEK
ncbi:MAG: hypothetical protein LBP22_01485 [Deltaproteobacteria bacterium]|jgi:hypothetical protein|nr:hypothetical protein [Deltaproteobacteria bacterium]